MPCDLLLSSDSINCSAKTFPLLGSRFLIMQQLDYNNGSGCFLCVPWRKVISEAMFGAQFGRQLNSVREAVKIGHERVMLKNLHC
jgi:hypothetical protein